MVILKNVKYRTEVNNLTRKKNYGSNEFHDFFSLSVEYKKVVPREFVKANVIYNGIEIVFDNKKELVSYMLDMFSKNIFCVCYDVIYTIGGLTTCYMQEENVITLMFPEKFRVIISKYFRNYSVYSYYVGNKHLSDNVDFIVDLKVLLNSLYLTDVPSSAKEVYSCFHKIYQDFRKWNLNIPFCDITSCSSILKYIFWKLNIKGKVFNNIEDTNIVLGTYYGSLFEMYHKGQVDNVCSIDMNNAYFSVIRLQNIWRLYTCKEQHLIDVEDIDYFKKFYDEFDIEKGLNPRLYKSLNYVVYVKFKHGYFPLRYPSNDKHSMNMAYYSGEGWYSLADLLCCKLFAKENTKVEIINVKKIQTDTLEVNHSANLFGMELTKHGFVDELFILIDKYPEYRKFFKFLMIMVYGNGVERFEKSLGRYYNASFSTLTTSSMRLISCIIRKLTNVYCIMSDNFVFDERDIFNVSKRFIPLGISFKIVGIGSIYISGTDRYYIWNKFFKKYSKHFFGTFSNVNTTDIENLWENIVFGNELANPNKPVVREVVMSNVYHYNVIMNKLGKRPLVGDYLYVTFGKTYISHDIDKLEQLNDVMTLEDIRDIFLDIRSNKVLECGFVLENEYISKSQKTLFIVNQSDGYIDSDKGEVSSIGMAGQEMTVLW